MTSPRKNQVSLEATPFYHCYVRCVRRAFLCGEDRETGENFDHRKQWIVSRLRFLSYVYAIDVCAYAVMSNHYHVVLHVDKARAESWDTREVAERWMQLYSGNMLVNSWLKDPDSLDQATLEAVEDIIETWRSRLYDIGWFMRGINETVARMANNEENCKGRFWEGRFKSQALLDEAALLSCMAYVDLNPIRAGMENSLNTSDFTSIQQRIYDFSKSQKRKQSPEIKKRIQKQAVLTKELGLSEKPVAPLKPFSGSVHTNIHSALPFTREDYFDLVDKTGRIIREDKRGFIPSEIPTVLEECGINPSKWIKHVKYFGKHYSASVGQIEKMEAFALLLNVKVGKGKGCSRRVYV